MRVFALTGTHPAKERSPHERRCGRTIPRTRAREWNEAGTSSNKRDYGAGTTNTKAAGETADNNEFGERNQKTGGGSRRFTRGPVMLTLQSDLHGNHLLGA